jgi:hypothetical protein
MERDRKRDEKGIGNGVANWDFEGIVGSGVLIR